jgi:hypothetical protein
VNFGFQPDAASHFGTRAVPAFASCSLALPSSSFPNLPTCKPSNLQTASRLTPFPATLTSPLQIAENTTTLTPVFATLTDRVKHKPFVCHSYEKQPGWGYLRSSARFNLSPEGGHVEGLPSSILFRINPCKIVSKQMTLPRLESTLMKKPGGRLTAFYTATNCLRQVRSRAVELQHEHAGAQMQQLMR